MERSGFGFGLFLPLAVVLASGCIASRPVTKHVDAVARLESEGLSTLADYVAQNPQDDGAVARHAIELHDQGRSAEARSLLESALEANETAFLHAVAGELAETSEERESHARRGIQIDGGHARARVQLAIALRDSGQVDRALLTLLNTLPSDVADDELLWAISLTYLKLGDVPNAVRFLEYGIANGITATSLGPARNWAVLASLYSSQWPKQSEEYRTKSRGAVVRIELPEAHETTLPIPLQLRVDLGVLPLTGSDADLLGFGRRCPFVIPETTGARAGLMPDDEIATVNGVPIANLPQLRQHVERDWKGLEEVSFEIDRAGTRLSLRAPVTSVWERFVRVERTLSDARRAYDDADYQESTQLARLAIGLSGTFFPAGQVLAFLGAVSSGSPEGADEYLSRFSTVVPDNSLFRLLRMRAALEFAERSASEADIAAAVEAGLHAQRMNPGSPFIESCIGIMHLIQDTKEGRTRAGASFDRALALGNGGWAMKKLAEGLDRYDTIRRERARAELNQLLGALASGLAQGLIGAAVDGASLPYWPDTQAGQQYTRTMLLGQ